MTDRTHRIDRPHMPESYGITGAPGAAALTWQWAREQLVASRNYWIATARDDGRAHATPVWGVWHDDAIWFGADARSVKARNLAAIPYAVVHLESGDDVVILEGRVARAHPRAMSDVLDAYEAKYGLRPSESDPLYRFVADRALLWREADFVNSATRITFG